MEPKQVAFITGSAKKRVGNAIAFEAARRGMQVALHFRSSAKDADESVAEIRALGVEAKSFQADLSDAESARQVCRAVIKHFGRIDLFVPAAGVWRRTPLETLSAEELSEMFRINTLAPFIACKEVGLHMCQQSEGGSIVLLGDIALERPYDHFSGYFISKGAFPTMTRVLANELAHRNPKVRVNCVHPGAVMLPENIGGVEKRGVIEKSLVKTLGSAERVAQAVFSFYENPYLSGSFLNVDGGESVSNS